MVTCIILYISSDNVFTSEKYEFYWLSSIRQRDTIEYAQLEFSELSSSPQSYRPHLSNRLSVLPVGGVHYVIITSYGLHNGHNRIDIQRPVADSLVCCYLIFNSLWNLNYEG